MLPIFEGGLKDTFEFRVRPNPNAHVDFFPDCRFSSACLCRRVFEVGSLGVVLCVRALVFLLLLVVPCISL
jgi:hypothetical protein